MDGDGRDGRGVLKGQAHPPWGARKQVEVKGAVAGAETAALAARRSASLPLEVKVMLAVLEQKARQRSRFHWR